MLQINISKCNYLTTYFCFFCEAVYNPHEFHKSSSNFSQVLNCPPGVLPYTVND